MSFGSQLSFAWISARDHSVRILKNPQTFSAISRASSRLTLRPRRRCQTLRVCSIRLSLAGVRFKIAIAVGSTPNRPPGCPVEYEFQPGVPPVRHIAPSWPRCSLTEYAQTNLGRGANLEANHEIADRAGQNTRRDVRRDVQSPRKPGTVLRITAIGATDSSALR